MRSHSPDNRKTQDHRGIRNMERKEIVYNYAKIILAHPLASYGMRFS